MAKFGRNGRCAIKSIFIIWDKVATGINKISN